MLLMHRSTTPLSWMPAATAKSTPTDSTPGCSHAHCQEPVKSSSARCLGETTPRVLSGNYPKDKKSNLQHGRAVRSSGQGDEQQDGMWLWLLVVGSGWEHWLWAVDGGWWLVARQSRGASHRRVSSWRWHVPSQQSSPCQAAHPQSSQLAPL